MGEVYRAKDIQLHRTVAIKVLPDEVKSDRERLRRFEQEARAASALNHPNIVTVFGVGESESVSYMAIELVEGKTLAEILAHAPLPAKKVLEIGTQIAEGLSAAHEAGIVHRDLKPANVMVTKTGLVKILDFGLAKRPLPIGPADSTVTAAAPNTRPGEVMGTAGYMSPEQARGDEVDFRSDQFSLGSVLYEIATGRRAFRKSTHIDTMSAVLNEDPEPIARIAPGVPAPLRWTIERCLAKLPAERYQSTRDLADELKGLKNHLSEISESGPAENPTRRRKLARLAVILAAFLIGAAGWALVGRGTNPLSPEFRRLTLRHGVLNRALFIPGSNSILYTASWEGQPARTYMTLPDSAGIDRPLDSGLQLPLAYSGDGSQVLVLLGVSRPSIEVFGTLAWWPALGGKPRPILDESGWADWAPQGQFLVAVRDTGAERIVEVRNAEGGSPRELYRTTGGISFLRIAPDEKSVAFIHHGTLSDNSGQVRLASLDGSSSRSLTPRFDRCFGLDWNRRTGEIWFTASRSDVQTGALWAVGPSGRLRSLYVLPQVFVLQSVSPSGERSLLASNEDRTTLTIRKKGASPRDRSWFNWTLVSDLSPDGKSVLFFDAGPTEKSSGTWQRPLEGGDAIALGNMLFGRYSPDGRWVVGVTPAQPPQVVLVPVGAGSSRQLTSPPYIHATPSFATPSTILFVRSGNKGSSEIWSMNADGSGAHALGARDCGLPTANAEATAFLCIGGDWNGAIFTHSFQGGTGRKIFELPEHGVLRYARWSERGERIFAVAADGRLLTLDGAGKLLSETSLPQPESSENSRILTAALSSDAATQAYSVSRFSSGLFLMGGLR
jgi:serine/threonine protein kinase